MTPCAAPARRPEPASLPLVGDDPAVEHAHGPYHGVLAPAARGRRDVVPSPSGSRARTTCAHERETAAREASGEREPPRPRRRCPWAELMRRVFAKDLLVCGRCGEHREAAGGGGLCA